MNESVPGAVPVRWHEYKQEWQSVDSEIIEEALISIYVNGIELATIMATPFQGDALALGFLKNEALIADLSEVAMIYVSPLGCCVDVWLHHAFEKPERVIITSGCGGGVTFDDPSVGIEPLQSNLHVSPGLLRQGFRQLQSPKSLYARSGGVHAAGLLDVETEKLIVVVEDVGRHNAIDKLTGICLQQEIATRDRILIATGRISSEMLRKAALMGCPIMASRNSPTSLSVEMARAWRVTLIGYVRSGKLRVYSHPERLGFDTSLT
ncbi:MAG: formate dehydrogenase accessory sulfurtransferase FdhD [Anaerolineae bacterium]|nr:formate dehydrogenase accessory sulfurtransferase FdhD [Anaerolineae bacterium]